MSLSLRIIWWVGSAIVAALFRHVRFASWQCFGSLPAALTGGSAHVQILACLKQSRWLPARAAWHRLVAAGSWSGSKPIPCWSIGKQLRVNINHQSKTCLKGILPENLWSSMSNDRQWYQNLSVACNDVWLSFNLLRGCLNWTWPRTDLRELWMAYTVPSLLYLKIHSHHLT